MSVMSVIRREASEADQWYTSLCSPLPTAAARLFLSRDHLALIDLMISTLTELSASASGLAHSSRSGGGPTYLGRPHNQHRRNYTLKTSTNELLSPSAAHLSRLVWLEQDDEPEYQPSDHTLCDTAHTRSQIEESHFCHRRCLLQNNMMD